MGSSSSLILEGQGQARLHLKFNPSWSYEWGPVHTTHVNPNVANAQIVANTLGVGPGYVQRNEYATEAWYGWQTTPWLNLKLDAQYVICPGGYTTPTNRNAFVLGVRTTVNFW